MIMQFSSTPRKLRPCRTKILLPNGAKRALPVGNPCHAAPFAWFTWGASLPSKAAFLSRKWLRRSQRNGERSLLVCSSPGVNLVVMAATLPTWSTGLLSIRYFFRSVKLSSVNIKIRFDKLQNRPTLFSATTIEIASFVSSCLNTGFASSLKMHLPSLNGQADKK